MLKTDDYVLYARVMKQEPAIQDQSEQDLKDYKYTMNETNKLESLRLQLVYYTL